MSKRLVTKLSAVPAQDLAGVDALRESDQLVINESVEHDS
jgi:hypothetical protein